MSNLGISIIVEVHAQPVQIKLKPRRRLLHSLSNSSDIETDSLGLEEVRYRKKLIENLPVTPLLTIRTVNNFVGTFQRTDRTWKSLFWVHVVSKIDQSEIY